MSTFFPNQPNIQKLLNLAKIEILIDMFFRQKTIPWTTILFVQTSAQTIWIKTNLSDGKRFCLRSQRNHCTWHERRASICVWSAHVCVCVCVLETGSRECWWSRLAWNHRQTQGYHRERERMKVGWEAKR